MFLKYHIVVASNCGSNWYTSSPTYHIYPCGEQYMSFVSYWGNCLASKCVLKMCVVVCVEYMQAEVKFVTFSSISQEPSSTYPWVLPMTDSMWTEWVSVTHFEELSPPCLKTKTNKNKQRHGHLMRLISRQRQLGLSDRCWHNMMEPITDALNKTTRLICVKLDVK